MVFYFTATGNSLYVAKELDDHPVSIAQAIHDVDKVCRDDVIGIVCPIFGHEMPELVKDFLKTAQFETDYFFVILTYGNRHGGAAELARAYLETLEIYPAYVNVVLMVDNYLPGFDMEEQQQFEKHVDEQLSHIKTDLAQRKRYFSVVTDDDRHVHQIFLERSRKYGMADFRELYTITEACVGCGICTKVCPKKCFHLEGQKSFWNSEGCIGCMACIHSCPTRAIQLNIPEINPDARYRNKNITLCEIVDANNQWNRSSTN